MTIFRIDDEIALRPFQMDDAEAVFTAVSKNYSHLKEYMHWMVPEYSLDSARDFIANSMDAAARCESLGFGIFRGNILIGSIGLVNFDHKAKRTEIGYWIDGQEQGKGIITRSCRSLIDHAFNILKMNRIELRCAVDNIRSTAVAERLGFVKEGVLRQSEMRGGKLHDFNVYGLLASEWDGR